MCFLGLPLGRLPRFRFCTSFSCSLKTISSQGHRLALPPHGATKASNIPTLQPSPAFVSFTAKIYPVNGRIQEGVQTPSCAAQAGNFCTHPRRVRCVERKPSRKRAVPQAPPTPPTPTRSQPRPRSAGRTVWGCRNATRRSLRGHMAQPLTSSRSPRQGGEAHCPPPKLMGGGGWGNQGPPVPQCSPLPPGAHTRLPFLRTLSPTSVPGGSLADTFKQP